MRQDVQIAVVTHKEFPYSLPEGYDLVQVGCAQKGEHWTGYIHDDTGEHISEKNASHCELTALYWLWKNSDADIKGLCHYRRFFSDHMNASPNAYYWAKGDRIQKECMKISRIKELLLDNDMIVRRPQMPYYTTAKEDLLIYCYEKDIDTMTAVIYEHYPDYQDAYDKVMNSRNISYCNMFIAGKRTFDQYCQWLFSVLDYCEERCDIENYDVQHKRLFGYLAEVLLNVYIERNALSCVHARCLSVSDYHPLESGKNQKLSYNTEVITSILYKIGAEGVLAKLYKKYRPEAYMRYDRYLEWLKENKG